MEKNYKIEFEKAIAKNDKQTIIDILKELLNTAVDLELIVDGEFNELESQRREVVAIIYQNLSLIGKLLNGLDIDFEELNYWIIEMIAFNKRTWFRAEIADEFVNYNKDGLNSEEFFFSMRNVIYKIVDATYKFHMYYNLNDNLIAEDLCFEVEEEIDYEIGLLINALTKKTNTERNEEFKELEKFEHANKFIGNPLSKRKNGNLDKYKKVAYLIKIFEDDYKYINGIQKKACEIAECSEYSFSKWKNARRKEAIVSNNKLVEIWQNHISLEIKIELIEEIEKFLKN